MELEGDTPFEPSEAQLKQTQFALGARIDGLSAGGASSEDIFAQLVRPQGGQRHRQQQAFEALGIEYPGMIQIEAAGFVFFEALLNQHPPAIGTQAGGAGGLIGDNGD